MAQNPEVIIGALSILHQLCIIVGNFKTPDSIHVGPCWANDGPTLPSSQGPAVFAQNGRAQLGLADVQFWIK